MKHWGWLFVLGLLPVFGQAPSANSEDEATHQAIRSLKDGMVAALNKGDIDGLLSYVHKNVVFTAMNGDICRGPDELRAYFNRMMKDPGHVVESLHTNPTVDRLTDLYGGTTGVAYGGSVDNYKLTTGQQFEVKARWSATLIKENDTWKLVSFQSAANIFDNPLLNKATSMLYWGAGGAGLAALLVGFLLGRWRRPSAA